MKVAAICPGSWRWLVALIAFAPLVVLADGMIIPQRVYAIPQIPDQRALIYYMDGKETLVVETSFAGRGTNFAWIVPLPARATIAPVSGGLFPTLQSIFQPRVVISAKPYWVALPVLVILFWIVNVVRRSTALTLVSAFIFLILVVVLLPALVPARSRASATGSSVANVRILRRQTAGLFDTVIIKSGDPGAVANWLNKNGFAAPTNMLPALTYYVRKGWVFAAARLNCEPGDSNLRATHPLAFTFNTREPVYPLRLTASGSDSCRIDLYVFGPGCASAPGFDVIRCEKPNYDSESRWPRFEAGPLAVRHKELAKLVAGAPVATKLSAVLKASDMSHDAYFSWPPYQPSGAVRYTRGAALTVCANVGVFSFTILVFAWWLFSRAGAVYRLWSQRAGPWLAPAAIVMGTAIYFWLPKIDSGSLRMTRVSRSDIQGNSFELALALSDVLGDTNVFPHAWKPAHLLTQAESHNLLSIVRRDYRNIWGRYERRLHPMTNCFTGELIRFEASPGNFILRPVNQSSQIRDNFHDAEDLSGYELIWHDLDGAEAFTNAVPELR